MRTLYSIATGQEEDALLGQDEGQGQDVLAQCVSKSVNPCFRKLLVNKTLTDMATGLHSMHEAWQTWPRKPAPHPQQNLVRPSCQLLTTVVMKPTSIMMMMTPSLRKGGTASDSMD